MLASAPLLLALVGVVDNEVPVVCQHFGLAEALTKQTKKPCDGLTESDLQAVTELTVMQWRAKQPLTSKHLEQLPYLEKLEVFGPGEKLGPRAFAKLVRLSQLKLRDLGSTFSWDSVRGVKYLDIFLLHGLKSLPRSEGDGLRFISKLWIDQSSFETLPPHVFSGLTELRFLSFTASRLRAVRTEYFQGADRLESIAIENGRLESWPAATERMSSLKILKLTGNRLTEINAAWLRQFPQLRELKLTKNQIRRLKPGTFAHAGELTDLSLARNPIERIENGVFTGLKRLGTLSLVHCEIRELAPHAFADPLPWLRHLELTGNRLENLPPNVFAGVTGKTVTLRLENNQIKDLPVDAFDGFKGVLFLYLERNPIDPALGNAIYRRIKKN